MSNLIESVIWNDLLILQHKQELCANRNGRDARVKLYTNL